MLSLAIATFDQLGVAIGRDLQAIEEELSAGVISQTDSYLTELKELCIEIEKKMNVDLKEAAQKLASLDQAGTIGAAQKVSRLLTQFSDRLRSIRTEIRQARGTVTPSSNGSVDGSATTVPSQSATQGYKPFIERLKPPTFSGKVEEWPEFRSVWKDLLAELPESVQIQHIKSHLLAADVKRIVGIGSMSEVWERLERVYGDTELNIVTVKSNLEGFIPKAVLDYKKIQEVYEAVESAVAQLNSLNALQYLKEDFGLMNKLVLKLPALEQVKYAEYITSVTVEADKSSRWDKFWTWLKQRHKAAVQSGLMQMCNKPSSEKASGSSVKSGVTCRTCGGIGHFARSCPSSQKSGSSPLVKVNIAVTKISTKAEYDQHIIETRKQVGSCPV